MTKNATISTRLFWILFFLGLISLVFVQYYSLIIFQYYSPPGDDPMNHYMMAKELANHGFFETLASGRYPPLYHYLVFNLSNFLHVDLLEVMVWTSPLFLIIASLSIFLCSYVLFGKTAGICSFIIYGFTANGNVHTQNDGMYPNLIATHVLLPLILTLFFVILKEKKFWMRIIFLILMILASILVVFTHHLSTLSLLGVVFLSCAAAIAYFWVKQKWTRKKGLSFAGAYIIIICLLLMIFFRTNVFASARVLAEVAAISVSSHFPFLEFKSTVVDKPWQLALYPKMIGAPLIWFGAVGLLLLPFVYSKRPGNSFVPIMILSIWGIFHFFVSRLSFVSFPGRSGMDMIVPLSIAAGGILGYFLYLTKRTNHYLGILSVLVLSAAFFSPFVKRIQSTDDYNARVRTTKADIGAVDYLSKQQGNDILVFGVNTYLPKFLPSRNFHIYDGKTMTGEIITDNYDFLYVVNKQLGWLPPGVPIGLPEKVKDDNNLFVSLEKTFDGPINSVEIYKVNKPVIAPKIKAKPKTTEKNPKSRKTIE